MRTKSKELMSKMIDYIDETYELTGRTPSYREIASQFSITSACVSNYIKEMTENKLITNMAGSRGVVTKKIQKGSQNIVRIPILGSIACGTPLLAQENIEDYIPFLKKYLGSGEYFILRANGNSMINANINDGDLVIVRIQEEAYNGQIVVALIGDEATLKKYYVDTKKKKIRLHPENDAMEDMYFDEIAIQGVAVKVIKDIK